MNPDVSVTTPAKRTRKQQFLIEREPEVTVRVETITPDEASALLAGNTKNRYIRPTRVNTYARAMLAGDWALNGETVKISKTGKLLDAQHRLLAVVETGVPLTSVVVRGLDDSVIETIDIGDKRTLGDTLRLRGEKNWNNLAAALVTTYRVMNRTMNTSLYWPTNRELLAFFEDHGNLRGSIRMSHRATTSPTRFPPSQAVALDYLFRQTDEGEKVDEFWVGLFDGVGLDNRSPVLALRNFLIKDLLETRRRTRVEYRIALTIKAWNLFRAGEHAASLHWSHPEPFPDINDLP